MKTIYVNKEEVKDEFIKEYPEYAAKRDKMEVTVDELYGSMMRIGRKVLITHSLYDPDIRYAEIGKIYGYCRISRKEQSIERQVRNIKAAYPTGVILREAYTGTKMERPEWSKLYKNVKTGDIIVFDSVSRMSRNADEGVKTYFELFERGVQLVFLKEHYIDTAVYAENLKDKIELQGTDEDEIFKGLNNYFRKLAERQIRIAFDQAEKEVQDLHQRTKEGIETARLNGKQIGQKTGSKLNVKKEGPAKEKIMKYSRDFEGTLPDPECIKLVGVSRNTFYKYKKQLQEL